MLTKIPSKEVLLPFVENLSAAAIEFNKSTRTIRRWLDHYEIYKPNKKYSPGKLDNKKASEIRRLEKDFTQAELAEKFGVSQPLIGRVINGEIYRSSIISGETFTLKGEANYNYFRSSGLPQKMQISESGSSSIVTGNSSPLNKVIVPSSTSQG